MNKIQRLKTIITKLDETEIKQANFQELMDSIFDFNKKNAQLMMPTLELSMMNSLNEILVFRRMVKLTHALLKQLPEEKLRKMAILCKLHSYKIPGPLSHIERIQKALQRKISIEFIPQYNPNLLDFGSSRSMMSDSTPINLSSGFFPGDDDSKCEKGFLADRGEVKSVKSEKSFNLVLNQGHNQTEDLNSLFEFF